MKLSYVPTVVKSLKFAIIPKRWLPFFLLDLCFGIFTLSFLFSVLPSLSGILSQNNPLAFASLLTIATPVIVGMIAWILVKLWISGAVIHQSYREKEFKKSWRVSLKKYPYLLVAMILITLITTAGGIIPLIGWIITIILSLIFYFVYQGILINNLGPLEAIGNSYKIFRRNIAEVFIVWLIITIIVLIVNSLTSLPATFMLSHTFDTLSAVYDTENITAISEVLSVVKYNTANFAIAGIIMLLGLAFSQTFSLKAQTEFYLQLRKRKINP